MDFSSDLMNTKVDLLSLHSFMLWTWIILKLIVHLTGNKYKFKF